MPIDAIDVFIKRISIAFIVCVISLTTFGCTGGEPKTPSQSPASASDASGDETNSDIDHRQLIEGTWEDDYQGKRQLTVRADGTATMTVELSGLNSLFANRLRFEETWSIADGHLTMKVTGGEPAGRVRLICQTMGDSTRQRILALDKEKMRLLDEDGETTYEWRRVQ